RSSGDAPVDLDHERAALDQARRAVRAKVAKLSLIEGGGADALADEYIAAVVVGAVEGRQHDLGGRGPIDDGRPGRGGLSCIDEGGDQLVVGWRAPFAEGFYQARFDEPHGL